MLQVFDHVVQLGERILPDAGLAGVEVDAVEHDSGGRRSRTRPGVDVVALVAQRQANVLVGFISDGHAGGDVLPTETQVHQIVFLTDGNENFGVPLGVRLLGVVLLAVWCGKCNDDAFDWTLVLVDHEELHGGVSGTWFDLRRINAARILGSV